MMNEDNKFTTPVGRLVMGAIYTPNTKKKNGQPMQNKDGSPRQEYWLALAVPKLGEQHWNQTEWGAHVYNFVNTEFAGKIPHNLAWKISDGDDRTPNEDGNIDADREGFKGSWIIKVKNGFMPAIHDCTAPGFPELTEKDAIQTGDYAQLRIEMGINRGSEGKPSVYLNHTKIGFIKHGIPIRSFKAEDVGTVGFQQAPPSIPPAAMGIQSPHVASVTQPYIAPPATQTYVTAAPAITPSYVAPAPAVTPIAVQPHPGILMPQPPAPTPPPAPAGRQMTAAAKGSYEQYVAQGWADNQLIQNGLMMP